MVVATNLSYAWGRAFLITMERSAQNMTSLTISVGGFVDSAPVEDRRIRQTLDAVLSKHDKYSCQVSALTIFPYRHWIRSGQPPRKELFDWYLNQFLPRLKARDSRNGRGTYFERMIEFQGVRGKAGKLLNDGKNQLEHIISLWPKDSRHSRPRQSALQVACFDPVKDHTGSVRSGFPCLQQVSFIYDNSGDLAINAYYPTQYIFDRAYGNYLGLCHLGHFMAHELGLKLIRLNCFVGYPELGDINKDELRGLEKTVREIFSELDK